MSPDLYPPNSPVDYRMCGLMQERVYIVQTPVRDTSAVTSDLKQRLIDTWASISQNVIDEAVGQWKKQLHASTKANDITLNICYTKTYSFQSQHTTQPALHQQSTEENANRANTLHNRLFSVYRRKRVVLRNFHRSYLKANKVSKSEGTKKVKYAYHFWKCAGAVYRRLSKLVHACIEATACQSWRIFLRHSVVLLRLAHYRLSNWQTVGFIQKMPTVQHSVFQNC